MFKTDYSQNIDVAKWINKSDSVETHYILVTLNWGFSQELIIWIIRNCICELASLAEMLNLAQLDNELLYCETREEYQIKYGGRSEDTFSWDLVEAIIYRCNIPNGVTNNLLILNGSYVPEWVWNSYIEDGGNRFPMKVPSVLLNPSNGAPEVEYIAVETSVTPIPVIQKFKNMFKESTPKTKTQDEIWEDHYIRRFGKGGSKSQAYIDYQEDYQINNNFIFSLLDEKRKDKFWELIDGAL